MAKIAILQFPGTNCEYETRRAARTAGLDAEFVRWNEPAEKLRRYAGYILPGGFSYEDRVRSGAIAAREEAIKTIRGQAAQGKPVLGICNGAQILVEAGLIPGVAGEHVSAALAMNKYGWLNIWTRIVNAAPRGTSAFNNFPKGHHFTLPIAHGEGRFMVPPAVLRDLIKHQQTVFRYADGHGKPKNAFPVNPNGAMYNLAGVGNEAGNVLALMPHPERVKEGHVIFDSMKTYLRTSPHRHAPRPAPVAHTSAAVAPPVYRAPKNSAELFVDLIITDNEAVTLEGALHHMGFPEAKVAKKVHWEIQLSSLTNAKKTVQAILRSGELFNPNKEIGYLKPAQTVPSSERHQLLVRYRADDVGARKRKLLAGQLPGKSLRAVKRGVVWQIDASDSDWAKILTSNILFNPHSQYAFSLTK